MTIVMYIKDKAVHLLIHLIMVLLVILIMLAFQLNQAFILFIITMIVFFISICFLYDYFRQVSFYRFYQKQLEQLDQKYFICELIKEPGFLDGKILYQSLYTINKSMLEKMNERDVQVNDFKDYVEMWIHEVKIPLAHLTLTVHNHKSDVSPQILEQVRKLENQVDQILYYVRCENSQKDYLIKSSSLSKVVKNVIMKNKDYFIHHKLKLSLHDLNKMVLTDSKWLEFIINQILNNSFQYGTHRMESRIDISAVEDNNQVILTIMDNGIGICPSDLPRVFEKSFTGYNGRIQKKSTGMGLYICQRLCQRLGHQIHIESVQNEYTKVMIIFHKDHYYDVVK